MYVNIDLHHICINVCYIYIYMMAWENDKIDDNINQRH